MPSSLPFVLFAFVLVFNHSILVLSHPHLLQDVSVPIKPGFTLTWSDDFFGNAGSPPSSSNWMYDLGTSYNSGSTNWGTGEIESYTNSVSNAALDGNGALCLTPTLTGSGGWTSARIESISSNFQCVEGKQMIIEASIKLENVSSSSQLGIWPAFWAMGTAFRNAGDSGWPGTGEWDILEVVNGQNTVHGTAHCGTSPGGLCNEPDGLSGSTPFTRGEFHAFALQVDRTPSTWQQESLTWFLDGVQYFQLLGSRVGDQGTWANLAQAPFFLLLNVAVGGAFPNGVAGFTTPTSDTVSGADSDMMVDYVAVYNS